jgi:CheY-like chemotaxis protein
MKSIEKILLAEDDPRDIELTLAGFEASNLANKVVVVRDGVEALDYLFRRGSFADRPGGIPPLALIDLKMPKMGGLEVLRTIRADQSLKLLPVVILTSSREESDLVESYKLGANAFVIKPIAFDAFLAAIQQIGVFWAVINAPATDLEDEIHPTDPQSPPSPPVFHNFSQTP